jgi:hypothetical protein
MLLHSGQSIEHGRQQLALPLCVTRFCFQPGYSASLDGNFCFCMGNVAIGCIELLQLQLQLCIGYDHIFLIA